MFEKEGDYIRFMATEDQEEMKNWVLSIRQSKVNEHVCVVYKSFLFYFFIVESNPTSTSS